MLHFEILCYLYLISNIIWENYLFYNIWGKNKEECVKKSENNLHQWDN